MQDTIQKLWCASVETEGIAASMMMRKADQRYIDRCLPLLLAKIDDLKALADSIAPKADATVIDLTDNINDTGKIDDIKEEPVATPEKIEDIPTDNQPLYRQIDKETIFVKSEPLPPTETIVEDEPSIPTIERGAEDEISAEIANADAIIAVETADQTIEEPTDGLSDTDEYEIAEAAEFEEKEDTDVPVPAVETPQPAEHQVAEAVEETVENPQPAEPDVDEAAEAIEEDIESESMIQEAESVAPLPSTDQADKAAVAEAAAFEEKEDADVQTPVVPKAEKQSVVAETQPRTTAIYLDEKLSRKISKNFRQAISLNDKFRFRRELFGNSSQQYDAALDLIAEMSSFDEARAYFLDNYGWDAENPDVKSFFTILSNHYSN